MLPARQLGRLFDVLVEEGYRCVGPTLGDGAVVYGPLAGPGDLPRGWVDRQGPGEYRLERSDEGAYFGYVVGPHSWKGYLFPARQRLWRMGREGFEVLEGEAEAPRHAFIGVRACELAAMGVQDRVFLGGEHRDGYYGKVREAAFVVAVSCTRSAATCFCASLGTGPEVRGDCDLALTEVLEGEHGFVVRAHSERGRAVLERLGLGEAAEERIAAAKAGVERAARQERRLESEGLPELLRERLESPRWEQVAGRCMACANCTMVCPTCFCSDVEDVSDLSGEHAERWRSWDSCFNEGFSVMGGGEVRRTVASRYRQWLTHKLGTWVEQFGTSGCVGCGRCIAWCPVGIDLTEEAAVLREEGT